MIVSPKMRSPAAPRQGGAVLVVSLIILVAVTLLGVSTMNTTQLGEKMAANTQELARAFQAAETALSQGFFEADFVDVLAGDVTDNIPDYGGSGNDADYLATFLASRTPPRGSGWSVEALAYHVNLRSTGTTGGNVATTVNGGAYQIIKP